MARPQLTEAEFAELKRQRDVGLRAVVEAVAKKNGWDLAEVHFHASCGGSTAECYCACPDGPCQHDWTGPVQDILNDNDEPCGSEVTCARCSAGAMSHDLRVLP